MKAGNPGDWKNDLLDRTLRFFDDQQNNKNQYVNDHVSLNPYNSLWPSWDNSYYAYNGSTTAPDCYKDVQWILMKKPVIVGHDQVEAYRDLITAVPNNGLYTATTVPFGVKEPWNVALGTNNRKIQTLDGRTVLEYPSPAFSPRVPLARDYPRLDEVIKPSAELKVKTISQGVSLTFVGCAVAAVSVSVVFGYILGRSRRSYAHTEVHEDDAALL